MPTPRDPVADLKRIAFLLEAMQEPGYRVRAFRSAATALAGIGPDEVAARAANGSLRELTGVGEVTERTILESLRGEEPVYLRRLESLPEGTPLVEGAAKLRAALKGDLHSHTEASDGHFTIREMAEVAIELGHEYLVITDHSPRLTIANGLSTERLLAQLDEIDGLNRELAPFRLLTGIEVDINEDGSLDQSPEVLGRLDVVVGSMHSALRMPAEPMTRRMVTALANPHLDVLGHCTGRMKRKRRNRPESTFDAEIVFAAAAKLDKAIEINCLPDRLDPPKRLLRLAVESGCRVSIDSDAHYLGQLAWVRVGCERGFLCGVTPDIVVNALPADELLAWTASHEAG
ncbi:MAG TPA: PHP domain-containing protein [Candidatus Limnocylindria bacterium]|nr:PHP domain-containing protein [Candidatus Limnocylindria bacterium]